ncbi:S49 family peptidase [Granulosicoccaceae sp. 1_MG-2023]|nr:S49 family peptidase [Granulosicoccaceae sp. 1_MG-2023]
MSETPNDGWQPAPAAAGKKYKDDPQWDKKLITELATASLKEQRKARRWSIFFRSLGFIYLGVVLFGGMSAGWFKGDGVADADGFTAVVDLDGVIAADQNASAEAIIDGLNAAFDSEGARAVMLRINSPGGSPVESGRIYDEMRRLREAHPEIPLYAVIGDTCASGGYYVASAADRIFADKASLVGSIGVRMDSFGFTGAMDKLGVERRLITAGENKGLLDPFSPVNEKQVEHLRGMLATVHQQFIHAVKEGRGERLSDDPAIYSGLVWSGENAVELGLIDELASDRQVARDVVGAEKMVNFTPQGDLLTRLSENLGASIASHLRLSESFSGMLR